MKKKIFVCAAITMVSIYANAQSKHRIAPPPPPAPPVENPAPPPPPPAPPVPASFVAPPLPPKAPKEIVSSTGYDIMVSNKNGKGIITVKRDGISKKIRMETWNANRKYYEKKYGQLPPPPPPPPPVIVKDKVRFTPPVIVKDKAKFTAPVIKKDS